MAGIGNEINAHLFGRLRATAVGQMDNFLSGPHRLDTHFPQLVFLAYACELYGVAAVIGIRVRQPFDCPGMPKCHPDILTNNISP